MENNFIKIYSNFLKNKFRPQKKIKVVFDCSNGTTGPILKEFRIKNLELRIINGNLNGNFPGHGPDPWAKGAMEQLKKEVLRQKADLGVIFDADGDRVFFIDNLGHSIEPDIIARLLIWHLNPHKAVYDIRCGWLVKNLKSHPPSALFGGGGSNLKIIESKVGHFYIKKLMRKIGADLGVEKSGHYYFKINSLNKFAYYDSGILAAIEIINAVSKLSYSLADFVDLLPQYYRSGEINVKMNNELGIMNYENLLNKIEKRLVIHNSKFLIHTSRLDGLIMEFNSSASPGQAWWFNIRPSNTEPLIRLNIESEDQKILEKKKKELIKLLKN